MIKAIETDDSDAVECILAEGMDPNTTYTVSAGNTSNDTTSTLHQAAVHNSVESVKVSLVSLLAIKNQTSYKSMG